MPEESSHLSQQSYTAYRCTFNECGHVTEKYFEISSHIRQVHLNEPATSVSHVEDYDSVLVQSILDQTIIILYRCDFANCHHVNGRRSELISHIQDVHFKPKQDELGILDNNRNTAHFVQGIQVVIHDPKKSEDGSKFRFRGKDCQYSEANECDVVHHVRYIFCLYFNL